MYGYVPYEQVKEPQDSRYVIEYNNKFKQSGNHWGDFRNAKLYNIGSARGIKTKLRKTGKTVNIRKVDLYLGDTCE